MICLTGNDAYMAPNRIKELREAQGMTLERLAELVGLSAPYVQRLENGKRNLAVKHFKDFASALKVAPRDLLELADGDSELIEAVLRADPAKKVAIAVLLGLDPDVVNATRPALLLVDSSDKTQ